MAYQNALSIIGNTPLVKLENLTHHVNVTGHIYAKVESRNPGGSIKDRAARKIIEMAYATKKLRRGQTVVEMTSGNMGSGLAVVCNVFGNPFVAVMSAGNSKARARMLESLGAKVLLMPQVDGTPHHVTGNDILAAAAYAKQIAQEENAFYVDQFNHPGSVLAHFETTAPEIWRDLHNNIHAFVASVGTAGTFVGCAQYLKTQRADIICVAVEPHGHGVLTQTQSHSSLASEHHLIQGIGYGFVPPHWRVHLADACITVSDDEAIHFRELLAQKEGLDVGYSSGANVAAAVKLLQKGLLPQGANVVTILCDLGLKYF